MSTEYNEVCTQCNKVSTEYNGVRTEYNEVNTEYNDLSTEYKKVNTEYNKVSTEYNEVRAEYNEVNTEYNDLTTELAIFKTSGGLGTICHPRGSWDRLEGQQEHGGQEQCNRARRSQGYSDRRRYTWCKNSSRNCRTM